MIPKPRWCAFKAFFYIVHSRWHRLENILWARPRLRLKLLFMAIMWPEHIITWERKKAFERKYRDGRRFTFLDDGVG